MWVSYMEKGRERKSERMGRGGERGGRERERGKREREGGRGGRERERRAEIEVTLQGPKYMKKYGVDRVR
jgi:hypothetical protein